MANSSSDSQSVAVFIDSTLETRLAILVSSSDTVSSLKRIIEMEHALAFPSIRDIIVKAVKVKRKGTLYHMSDSMHLNDMFQGGKRTLFLQIEAEKTEKFKANASEENGILDKSHPPAQNLQNIATDGENKDSKEISTVTNHAINSPEEKKKRKKPMISENPEANGTKTVIPDEKGNQAGGTGTATSTGTNKVKSRKVGTKKNPVSQEATEKTENLQNISKNGENKDSKETSTGTNHVIDAENNLVTEANGTKTITPVAEKGNQDAGTGTGTGTSTETKKMKSVGTKKEKKKTKKAKVSSNDNAGEINPNHEAELKSKPNLASIDKNGISSSLNGDAIIGSDENNTENASKFEIIALSSQEENENNLDSNLAEKPARRKIKKETIKRKKYTKKKRTWFEI